VTRTVETDALTVRWDTENPEAIVYVSWKGSPNLTQASYWGTCPGLLVFFGNSWANDRADPLPSLMLVSGGAKGTWEAPTDETVVINSIDEDCTDAATQPASRSALESVT